MKSSTLQDNYKQSGNGKLNLSQESRDIYNAKAVFRGSCYTTDQNANPDKYNFVTMGSCSGIFGGDPFPSPMQGKSVLHGRTFLTSPSSMPESLHDREKTDSYRILWIPYDFIGFYEFHRIPYDFWIS